MFIPCAVFSAFFVLGIVFLVRVLSARNDPRARTSRRQHGPGRVSRNALLMLQHDHVEENDQ